MKAEVTIIMQGAFPMPRVIVTNRSSRRALAADTHRLAADILEAAERDPAFNVQVHYWVFTSEAEAHIDIDTPNGTLEAARRMAEQIADIIGQAKSEAAVPVSHVKEDGITPAQMGELLGITAGQVKKRIRAGQIQAVKFALGGTTAYLIPREEVERVVSMTPLHPGRPRRATREGTPET